MKCKLHCACYVFHDSELNILPCGHPLNEFVYNNMRSLSVIKHKPLYKTIVKFKQNPPYKSCHRYIGTIQWYRFKTLKFKVRVKTPGCLESIYD